MRTIISAMLVLGLMAFALADDPVGEKKDIKAELKQAPSSDNPIVLMEIAHGDTVLGIAEIEIYEHELPIHGGNFLKLVDEGYYDSLTFHRVVPGFVIQGGDPTGTGTGGPPGRLQDDESSPYKHDYATIAMARSGAGASKSQFYVNLKENYFLDPQGFLIFAKVIKGMDIFERIAGVETSGSKQSPKPVTPVIMTKVYRKQVEKKADEVKN